MNNNNLLLGLLIGVVLGNDKARAATLDFTNKLANGIASELKEGTVSKSAVDTIKKINEAISSKDTPNNSNED